MLPINGAYVERRWPTCYVLITATSDKMPGSLPGVFGPFENDETATLWASEQLPERVIFQIVPVYATVYP